jgi:hypothetical protein
MAATKLNTTNEPSRSSPLLGHRIFSSSALPGKIKSVYGALKSLALKYFAFYSIFLAAVP